MIKGKLALKSLTSEILYIATILSVRRTEIHTLLHREEEKKTPYLTGLKHSKSPKPEDLD